MHSGKLTYCSNGKRTLSNCISYWNWGIIAIIHCYYIPSQELTYPLKSQFWVDDFPCPVWWDMWSFPCMVSFCCCLLLSVLRLLRTNWHHRTNGPPDSLGEWRSAFPRHGWDTVPWYGWFRIRRTYNNKFTTQIVCGLEELHVFSRFCSFCIQFRNKLKLNSFWCIDHKIRNKMTTIFLWSHRDVRS